MTDTLADPFDPAIDLTIGARKGDIELVWFVDYTCPVTRGMADLLRSTVESYERGDLVLAVRQSPSPFRLPDSDLASRAAVAASKQDAFSEMSRLLFAAELPFQPGAIDRMAEELGLDSERFAADLRSDETARKVAADRASAEASNIHETPSLFIGNRRYLGAWDETNLIEAFERPAGLRIKLASMDFFAWAASAGLVLILATLAALIVANIGLHDAYETFQETDLALRFGASEFFLPLEVWINDGLMTIFFLLVGIEIKRELVSGELSDAKSAALPILAAVGGMAVPALIFVAINWGEPTIGGWGVPMATDIAFTLGLMALLGDRVPASLKVFVSALAIADDLGAIVIIALFYGHGFDIAAFGGAVGVCLVLVLFNRLTIYARLPYILAGIVLWVFLYRSGIHATLAGVLTAAAIPARAYANPRRIAIQARSVIETELARPDGGDGLGDRAFLVLQNAFSRLRDPGFHLEKQLERWSSFLILPLFAFFNTGIAVFGSGFSPTSPASLGVIAGLVIGKPLGIFAMAWLAVRSGVAVKSDDFSWTQVMGAGCLAGVGFTMSIFIGSAAFSGDELESVKLAVLIGSVIATMIGMGVLKIVGRPN